MYRLLITILLCSSLNGHSQTPTSDAERISTAASFDEAPSKLNHLEYENIGPTIFSGRVSDIAVDPDDPTHFYVAYASGGLWETVNNGTTFDPIFDNEVVMTIGAIAVNWVTDEIWVGTGEVNSSRSSYAGVGVYKSDNNGETWNHIGLTESHHIGRIILHPARPNTAWVAVLGHLYSSNAERGLYMTMDGGTSWSQTLAIDPGTGVVDLVMDTQDPDVLYAAAWERSRSAWDFVESGAGSGIYKSIDGGLTWAKLSGDSSGFPDGPGTGRIGLSASVVDGTTTIYALLDNYDRRPQEDKEEDGLVKEDFKKMSKSELLDLKDEDLKSYLKSNRFPEKYTAKKVKQMISDEEIQPGDLASYLENANAMLFDTPVIGAELYKSTDGGTTWTKTHDDYLDGLYYSYGYYFGVVRSNPTDPSEVYIAGVPILRSEDGGATFNNVGGQNVHSDHHAIWMNPDNHRHIINGNDGGINISYDSGENWIKCNAPSVGQFYYINADHAKTYNVYGGTQDNGVWKGSHQYRSGVRWQSTGRYPYQSVMGGDGMQVQIDPRDNNTIYTGFQFGNYYRVDVQKGKRKRITPSHDLGEPPFRWNWQTPIHLSTHQPDILYMGSHRLFRSLDRGDTFDAISDDLTQGGKTGDVPYGTLTAIHESPLVFGLLYVGSDDGYIHVSQDGGHSWDRISDSLPQDLWVSRVQASAHSTSRVYASLNGYRSDDFSSYAYVSEDFGQSWDKIGSDLPVEPINVIKEDPHHDEIIYIGTDRGTYISLDGGQSFDRTATHMPNVPVHDIVVQAAAKDLLIGTHGRSIFRADLDMLYEVLQRPTDTLIVLDLSDITYRNNLGDRNNSYSEYRKNEQDIVVYAQSAGKATMDILTDDEALTVQSQEVDLVTGINYLSYDLSLAPSKLNRYKASFEEAPTVKKAMNDQYYLLASKYKIRISQGEVRDMASFEIKER